jgi:general stress protein 26
MNHTVMNENEDAPVNTEKKIDDLYKLIHGIDIAMMTTLNDDGSLVSRPMSTQKKQDGVDLWFMTRTDTHKIDEIVRSPNINLAYYKDGEWVSVSGIATITQDRAKIHELYEPSWKAWLEDQGGSHDGSRDDPRIALINVEVQTVSYFKKTAAAPIVWFQIAKAMVTGAPPDIGEQRYVDRRELKKA